jgi:hypothetical protein
MLSGAVSMMSNTYLRSMKVVFSYMEDRSCRVVANVRAAVQSASRSR